jgi:hypothetical protein
MLLYWWWKKNIHFRSVSGEDIDCFKSGMMMSSHQFVKAKFRSAWCLYMLGKNIYCCRVCTLTTGKWEFFDGILFFGGSFRPPKITDTITENKSTAEHRNNF